MMAARLDRPPLAMVNAAALPAAPSKAGQGEHFLLEGMVDRDGQCAVPIHFGHLSEKFSSVIRPPLEDVVLPLMDHLVRQCADELVPAVGCTGQQGLQKRKREADLTLRGFVRNVPLPGGARAGAAYEHADRRGQPPAPDEVDRRECSIEMPCIEVPPHRAELLRGQGSIRAYYHLKCYPSSSATAATSKGSIIS